MDTTIKNFEPEEHGQGFALSFFAVSDLKKAAKWAKFLAIVGFVFTGLIAISAFSVGAIMSSVAQFTPMGAALTAMSTMLTIIYLIIAAVLFMINLFLYQFATRAIRAIESSDSGLMDGGMHRLQSFFKAMGIIMIIYLALIVLIIGFAVLGSALIHH
ncbi:hypothetical protein ACFGVR_06975 [Mucilaginibacter sp. AW1-3]